jgi:uncharacterized protein
MCDNCVIIAYSELILQIPGHIEVVIKPTLQCNAVCNYCNVTQKPQFMDIAVVERLFQLLSDYVDRGPQSSATILWHGGEPMLMGAEFFKEALEVDRKIFEKRPIHLMQSNLTLATPDLLDVLRDLLNDRAIGTSLDPFEDYRRLKDGSAYLDRWYEGFELAVAYGFRVGMVYVVHGESVKYPQKLYYYFKNLGLDSLTIIPLEEPAGAFGGHRLDAASWGRFLSEIYEVWRSDNRPLPLEPFATWESLSLEPDAPSHSYKEALNCCEPTLAISPEGDIYPCVRMMDISTGKIGNALSDSLDGILAHPDASWRSARSEIIRQGECGSCRWWKFCAGGCAAASGVRCKTVWCEGYKLFFEATHA